MRSLSSRTFLASLIVVMCLGHGAVRAQTNLNALRGLSAVGSADAATLKSWITAHVATLSSSAGTPADIDTFRKAFSTEWSNPANLSPFLAAFAQETAKIAAAEFGKANLAPHVGIGLAQVLKDMADSRRVETVPGLQVGLSSGVEAVRYLSAQALRKLHGELQQPANQTLKQQVITALTTVAPNETSGPVLGRMYLALAFSDFDEAAFNGIVVTLKARAARLQAGKTVSRYDGAETGVLIHLADQKSNRITQEIKKLPAAKQSAFVAELASLLKYLNTRRAAPVLNRDKLTREAFYEKTSIEGAMIKIEEIFAFLAGQPSGSGIRAQIEASASPAAISQSVASWIGNADSNVQGKLNNAPWNVPVGG